MKINIVGQSVLVFDSTLRKYRLSISKPLDINTTTNRWTSRCIDERYREMIKLTVTYDDDGQAVDPCQRARLNCRIFRKLLFLLLLSIM